jgi:hypothetical protein
MRMGMGNKKYRRKGLEKPYQQGVQGGFASWIKLKSLIQRCDPLTN